MIKDRIVRVRLKKHYKEQRPWSYVGKVTAFNDHWLVMEGRGIVLARQQSSGVEIDKKPSAMMIPRENIETIRVLPDSFDVTNMTVTTEGQQLRLVVDKALDAYLGDLGEG
ncbi:MAG: hypothetical protein IT368_01955 [Candidatus Hydrogenedentes bacterium]|nr:hypothetical protein [Candidatus Hydrogenedentota bacterium]